MPTPPYPIKRALQIMDEWLNLPETACKADVYWFGQRLPPDVVLEAVEIAKAKIPKGGMPAFKYFCGVCHRQREKLEIQNSWNEPQKR